MSEEHKTVCVIFLALRCGSRVKGLRQPYYVNTHTTLHIRIVIRDHDIMSMEIIFV